MTSSDLLPGLERLLKAKNASSTTEQLLRRYAGDAHGPASAAGSTLTEADGKIIARALREEERNEESKLLDYWRKNGLCAIPPRPRAGESSELYQILYLKMLESPMYVGDDLRRKLWALIYLEDNNPSLKKEEAMKMAPKVDEVISQWENKCGRTEDLNVWISEKRY